MNRLSPRALNLPLFCAALAASSALSAQVTTIPTSNPIALQHGWTQECEARVRQAKGHRVDLLFIGDSITQNFVEEPTPAWNLVGRSVWDKHYGNRNALDFGVGADGTEHILWRMEHMQIGHFRPKAVIILAGINDAQFAPEEIAAGVEAVVGKTRSMYPKAKIVLMNILPSNRAKPTIDAANPLIEKLADNRVVFSLDLAPYMPSVGDNWLGVGGDHVHLTAEGYEIWASHLDPLLDRILAH